MQQRDALVVIHVDDADMRLPRGQDRFGFGERLGATHHEQTVIQGEFDQVDDQLAVVQHECPTRVVDSILPRGLALIHQSSSSRTGWDFYAR